LTESESKIKLKPKCISYKEPALTAEGFFLPCCWCDGRDKWFKDKGFLDPKLNIENVEYPVTDIFNSKTWIDFFDKIEYDSDYPNVCLEHCGINEITNKKIINEPI